LLTRPNYPDSGALSDRAYCAAKQRKNWRTRHDCIANANFIPKYPTNTLPGGIPQKLAVDLRPLTPDQAQVFMQIEYPEFPPVALLAGPPPATIGAFYDTIALGFTTVNPTINPNAFAINSGEATPIKSIVDALAAIALIKGEGGRNAGVS
jgi:Ferritin-like